MRAFSVRRLVAAVAVMLSFTLMSTNFPVNSLEYDFSASYRSGIFYRRLCNVTLTGDQRTDIVNVALSQVNYKEGNSKTELSGLSEGSKNYTEYCRWYDTVDDRYDYTHSAWCAMFVSWCANQAGISSDTVYYHALTTSGLDWYRKQGLCHSRAQIEKGTYTPLPGDIVYFKSSANGNEVNHIGIVVRYGDGVLYAVEGNAFPGEKSSEGGQVCIKSYTIDDTFIRYVCSPNYR